MTAKRNTVADGVPQFWMRSPRFNVMDFQPTAAMPAFLARPVVAGKAGCTKLFILGGLMVFASDRGRPINPVRVRPSDKMVVARRNATGSTDAFTDVRLVLGSQRPTEQSLRYSGDGLFSGLRRHHVCVSSQLGGGCDLGPCRIGFRRIRRAVPRFHFAGVPAKESVLARLRVSTLNTQGVVHGV